MVASRGGDAGRALALLVAPLAAGLLLAAAAALDRRPTEWLHSLLSFSSRRPVPPGEAVDFGIVLGYALHRNGSCTRPLQSRVEVGVQLFEQGAAARLVFSGAHPGGGLRNVSEANAMAEYAQGLVERQPPPGLWLLEDASTSTRTNALYSLAIVQQQLRERQQQQQQQEQQQQPPPSVAVVTNPFHQLRSYLTFRRAAQQAGLDVRLYVARAPFAAHRGYGCALADAAADQLDFWRELAALCWYGLRGWL